MTGSGSHPSSSLSRSRAPIVTVVSQGSGLPGGGALPPGSRSRQSARGQGLYVWIVMSLLVASTTLAVYDLFVLTSALVGGG